MSRKLLSTLLLTTLALSAGCATQHAVKPEAAPAAQEDAQAQKGTQEQKKAEAPPAAAQKVADVAAMDMVFVKGGCYQMGDQFAVGRPDELPLHEVCLDDFYIGKFEVTQGQWQALMGTNPSGAKECGPDCPVENVSWNDAQTFVRKLNELTKKTYRLPTEAEWEYAARSGGQREMYAGVPQGGAIGDFAWYEENSDGKIHPVGQKKPNVLGIYDMSGNVWEWCQDVHRDDYYKNAVGKNPGGPKQGSARVTRGGSYSSAAWHLRIADRGRLRPSRTNPGQGVRLVLPVEK